MANSACAIRTGSMKLKAMVCTSERLAVPEAMREVSEGVFVMSREKRRE